YSRYGILTQFGTDNVYSNLGMGGSSFDVAAIAIGDGTQANNVFIAVEAVNLGAAPSGSVAKWTIGGANSNGLTFISCTPSVGPLLPVTTFAGLPATPAGGMTYTITDGPSSVAAPGTLVTSGGGSTKMLLWYNGSNWKLVSL